MVGRRCRLPRSAGRTAGAAGAGDYPNKSIRLVVPSAPGGGTDIIARWIGQGLTDAWGQTVVVDNRGGGGGTVGVTIVAKAAPDGYTMLLGSVGHLTFAPAVRPEPRVRCAERTSRRSRSRRTSRSCSLPTPSLPAKSISRARSRSRRSKPGRHQVRLGRRRLGLAPGHRAAGTAPADFDAARLLQGQQPGLDGRDGRRDPARDRGAGDRAAAHEGRQGPGTRGDRLEARPGGARAADRRPRRVPRATRSTSGTGSSSRAARRARSSRRPTRRS